MAVNYETLHEADEPRSAPWTESRLVSLADMLLGGIKECDMCRRWQRIIAFEQDPKGWTKRAEQDLCPKCSEAGGNDAD